MRMMAIMAIMATTAAATGMMQIRYREPHDDETAVAVAMVIEVALHECSELRIAIIYLLSGIAVVVVVAPTPAVVPALTDTT